MSYVHVIDPVRARNQRIKESQNSDAPKHNQNRGRRTMWETQGGKEDAEVTIAERETETQRAWRERRQSQIRSDADSDARSAKVSERERSPEPALVPNGGANNHAPERGNISPEIRKLDDELKAKQISEGWSEAQVEFEKRKLAKRAGIQVEELNKHVNLIRSEQGETRWDREWTGHGYKAKGVTSAQKEWIEKKVKEEDPVWNEGGTWLKRQVGSAGDEFDGSAPGKSHQEDLIQGDINVPRKYRNRAQHATQPSTLEEQQAWENVRGRPRDQWYARHPHKHFPVEVHEPTRSGFQIPTASGNEQQWEQGEEWLRQQFEKEAAAAAEAPSEEVADDEQPPAPPPPQEARSYSVDPLPHPDHAHASWRDYLVDEPYSASTAILGKPVHLPPHYHPRYGGPGFEFNVGPFRHGPYY
eukprot:TRINITY_DN26671_c0_g5_i1.p1 TRINITY_DN26671_c0_g5~~TRINITY_DN26671_c0_g5_i1.p1  ORF type:complete len:415 (-),score=106.66 TRINITY_DN26671_c0_g5_i1:100-1344(-)